jgi:hypothetical protein
MSSIYLTYREIVTWETSVFKVTEDASASLWNLVSTVCGLVSTVCGLVRSTACFIDARTTIFAARHDGTHRMSRRIESAVDCHRVVQGHQSYRLPVGAQCSDQQVRNFGDRSGNSYWWRSICLHSLFASRSRTTVQYCTRLRKRFVHKLA